MNAGRASRPLLGAGLLAALVALAACAAREETGARWVPGGDAGRGESAIRRYGCGACHAIPGIAGAHGTVGPSLDDLPHRTYVGGVVINSPENLVRWIEDPRAIDPATAMPSLDVAPRDARDIASYLYSLD